MLTLNQKKLIDLANTLHAEKMTGKEQNNLDVIAVSTGTYGMNGAILRSRDDASKFYVIPTRSTLLFYYV